MHYIVFQLEVTTSRVSIAIELTLDEEIGIYIILAGDTLRKIENAYVEQKELKIGARLVYVFFTED